MASGPFNLSVAPAAPPLPGSRRVVLMSHGTGGNPLAEHTAQGLLGLCEGIETGLAVMRACPTLPVWAALSTSGMEQAQLPPEARRIVIGRARAAVG